MSKIRILLVEDDADHQWLLRAKLAEDPELVDVDVAGDAEAFLAAIASNTYSCIVMDYNLRAETAIDVLGRARELLKKTPVIVISSSTAQRVVVDSLRLGVSDYVPKHEAMESGVLWKRVERAIDRRRGAEQERRHAERRIREWRRAAESDPLTGLRNRRYAARLLAKPVLRGPGERLAITMIDIDFFKSINDRFGHAAGDELLRHMARILNESATGNEALVRWGGEEFLVVKSVRDTVEAWVWADRLRRRVHQFMPIIGGRQLEWTVSAGVAMSPAAGETTPGNTTGTPDELIREADEALYLAKSTGRNRVCTARMVEMLSIAQSIGAQSSLTPAQRIRAFLQAADANLGRVQREHLGEHSDLVRRIAVSIAAAMRLPAEGVESISLASLAHDIGKVGIPEDLLAKPALLSADEKRYVHEHVRFGAELAQQLGLPGSIVEIIAAHHVRFDVIGTPESPLIRDKRACSIVSLADAFAAMIEDRPYARHRTMAQVLGELRREQGRQFDPEIVETIHFVNHEPIVCKGELAGSVA